MAETLISPGVLARENDSSFVTRRPVTVGAAIIGPTAKGPVEVPTVVTTYNQFVNVFGTTFLSGSDNDKKTYSYFTSIAAYNYFVNGGTSLLVSRVVSGSYLPATASIDNNVAAVVGNTATLSFTASVYVTGSATGSGTNLYDPVSIRIKTVDNDLWILPNTSYTYYNTTLDTYLSSSATANNDTDTYMSIVADVINDPNADFSNIGLTASYSTSSGVFTLSAVAGGTALNGVEMYKASAQYQANGDLIGSLSGGTPNVGSSAFELETLSEGALMNSAGPTGSNNTLLSGSDNNLRWQVVNSNIANGTFDLLVRRGDDNSLQPTILETWTNLSLDPNSPNYVARAIGNQVEAYDPADNQMEITGEYAIRSNYVRVKQVNYTTPNYFDNNGIAKAQYTASLPINSNGVFGGAEGSVKGGANFYNNINNTDTQGLTADCYDNMINLLSNTDDYKFNMLITPGLVDAFPSHTGKISNIITNTQDRGDNIYIIDPVGYGSSVSSVVSQAASRNTSYAAEYWPWCQIIDPSSGNLVWVPASTLIAGVYAYNDAVSEPWFAPAGINRGGLSQVVRVEQKLSQANRDSLYNGKVNPIATFPGSGIVVYGQKTLQTKASALDRVNVRRLLIALKSYISQIALNLVFEQNTIATRNQFLSQVNPYLTSVQQRQGLYAFKVIMDDTNNTPDVIDRNELIGQIYLQPTKTAEFIYLDFNITPTGATFPG